MAEKQDERPVPMEGRSRGPNIHSGGTQDIGAPTPPYEGRQETGKDQQQLVEERGGKEGHDAGPREVSETEREGVHPADTTAASPMGVGESRTAQGNEQLLGESEEERRASRMETSQSGVDPKGPIQPDMPEVRPGDQGG